MEQENGGVATMEKPIKDGDGKAMEEAKDAVSRVDEKPNVVNGSINDVILLAQKEFNTWIRQIVITGLAKCGQWIDYKRFEKSVKNGLRGQWRKKVSRAVRDGMITIGYYKSNSGQQHKILCLDENDPQHKAALTIFQQSESKKLDGEIENHRQVLKKRTKEIEKRYETIKKNPTECLEEVHRLEVVIETLMNERSRLIQAAMDKEKSEKSKSMGDYIGGLEKMIKNLPSKIVGKKESVKPVPVQDGLELSKEIDKASKDYNKRGGLRIKTDETKLTLIGQETINMQPDITPKSPEKKKGFLSRIFG